MLATSGARENVSIFRTLSSWMIASGNVFRAKRFGYFSDSVTIDRLTRKEEAISRRKQRNA